MIIQLIVIVLCTFAICYVIERQARTIADLRDALRGYDEVTDDYSDATETDEELDVWHEQFMERRGHAFEQRIDRIKEELANDRPTKPSGYTADVLADGVYNLPHDSIIDYETNPPDIEYSK